MPNPEVRMRKMLFDRKTTYRTDYHKLPLRQAPLTSYKEKPTCLMTRPPPLKDLHTLTPWKLKPAPFSLMHRPQPIIGEDPTKVQEPYVKPPDEKLEETIKTRPRQILTPAVSIDDIKDRQTRAHLIDNIYTSSMTKAMEVSTDYFIVKAPFPGLPAPSNPITLPKPQLPYVSPEWRKETLSWDRKQLRTHCDATKEFWLREKLPPCGPCRVTEEHIANKKLICQMKIGKQG